MTERLFYEDSHMKSCRARVLAVLPADRGVEVELDRTVFFPEGGGQPCDRGTIGGRQVLYVREEGDRIFHGMENAPEPGTEVDCEIDWAYRFSLMQNHSAEHVVCGIVHRRFGYDNVGFHMGTDYITCDFNGPLTKEVVREVEREANRVVWQDVRVRGYFPSPEELAALEYRSKLDLKENVHIVEIEGVDRCACCAPHVTSTGEIGQIRLLEAQAYKGGTRVYMLSGERALLYTEELQDQAYALAVQFSVKPLGIEKAVETYMETQQALKEDRNSIQRRYLKLLAASLPNGAEPLGVRTALTGEDLRIFANDAASVRRGPTAVLGASGRYILVSGTDKQDMRAWQKEWQNGFKAKGGGSEQMVQGSVSAEDTVIRSFLEVNGGMWTITET